MLFSSTRTSTPERASHHPALRPVTPPPTMTTAAPFVRPMAWLPGSRPGRAVRLPSILQIPLPQALVAAEEDVLGHVRREPAGGGPAAQCLGEAPNVMRPGAAADAEIARAERQGLFPE